MNQEQPRPLFGLSLLTLVPGEVGGTETYVRELTRALAAHGTLSYRAFVPPLAADAASGLPADIVAEYGMPRTLARRFFAMATAAARPARIRARLERADALHYPLTIALPEARRRFAVTLHDMLHRDRPELFPRWEAALRRFAYDRSARRAAVVIVPSAFVGERTAERLGICPDRIRVVHHGIDHERFSAGHEQREPFVLYPARPWPHKNHARLFEAFALVRSEHPGLRLVLTGGGHGTRALPAGVEVRGLVPAAELVSLLRRASALVFPSLYEGFGTPPLEAMACGCPVAASRAASLPEVCGDAAELFDPMSPEAIAAAVGRVLDDPAPYVRRGLERARSFTWQASASGHEAAYRELVA